MRSISRDLAIRLRHLHRRSLFSLEQRILKSKTGDGWEIYSDFEANSLEASHVLQNQNGKLRPQHTPINNSAHYRLQKLLKNFT